MVALLLYTHSFNIGKMKNCFNILDIWSKVYPEEPLWKMKGIKLGGKKKQVFILNF